MIRIEFSQATKRDFRHICESVREFWEETKKSPFLKIMGLVIALMVAVFFMLPWLLKKH